jgi:hypothetical protein
MLNKVWLISDLAIFTYIIYIPRLFSCNLWLIEIVLLLAKGENSRNILPEISFQMQKERFIYVTFWLKMNKWNNFFTQPHVHHSNMQEELFSISFINKIWKNRTRKPLLLTNVNRYFSERIKGQSPKSNLTFLL